MSKFILERVGISMDIVEVGNAFIEQLKRDGKKPLTLDSYKRDIDDFHKRLKIKTIEDLQSLGRKDVSDYINELIDEYAPTTVNHKIAVLKVYYSFLVFNGYAKESLIYERKKLTVPPPKYKFLDTEEMDALLDLADNLKTQRGYLGVRDALVIQICLSTGLRIFEVRKIKIQDINFKEGSIHVVGKGDIEGTLYLPARTLRTLQEWLNIRSGLKIKEGHEDFLFISNRGTNISKRRLQQIVEEYSEMAGKKVSSHKLRHTFATQMVGSGTCTDEELQGMLRHKHKTTTELYRHTLEIGLKKSRQMPSFA